MRTANVLALVWITLKTPPCRAFEVDVLLKNEKRLAMAAQQGER